MTVSASQFLVEFPEFSRASITLIDAKIADADALTAPDYSPTLRDLRVKYMTCELLALSPYGEFARLDPNKQDDGARSIYERLRLDVDRSTYAPIVI